MQRSLDALEQVLVPRAAQHQFAAQRLPNFAREARDHFPAHLRLQLAPVLALFQDARDDALEDVVIDVAEVYRSHVLFLALLQLQAVAREVTERARGERLNS